MPRRPLGTEQGDTRASVLEGVLYLGEEHAHSSTMQTVRFTQLVEECGKPDLKVLWGSAEGDRDLQRAVKQERILSIHQENVGTKADFGMVGFIEEPHTQFLIFPKSLRAYRGRRVVGIKYEVFETPVEPGAWVATSDAREKKLEAARKKTDERERKEEKRKAAETLKRLLHREAVEPAADEVAEVSSAEESPAEEAPEPERKRPRRKISTQEAPRDVETAKPHDEEVSRKTTPPVADREIKKALETTLRELRRSVKELEAGKSVPVYKRLTQLISTLESLD